MSRLFRALFERNVVQWLLGYLAGSWVLLEATSFLVSEYGWPSVLLRVLPVVLGFGVLSTITLAWFHGEAGWQKVTARELWLHALIAAGMLVTVGIGGLPDLVSGEPADPPLNRVAVLYFKDHTADNEYSGLVQDLTEGVVHELAQVEPLDVPPLTAVAPYREEPEIDRIVDELGVGSYVEGSVTRARDTLQVTAQLIETATHTHLGSWNWKSPGDAADVSAAEVARWAADRVRQALGAAIRTRQLEAGTDDAQALALYREATVIYGREGLVDVTDDPAGARALLATADSLLALAEQRDRQWVAPTLLRAEIAEVRSRMHGAAEERDLSDLAAAIEHADRALRIGTDSAAALETRGTLRYTLARHSPPEQVDSLLAAAEMDLRAAHRLDPRRPRALSTLSAVVDRQGKLNSAYRYAKRAVEADAFLELGAGVYNRLIEAALQLERVEEADQTSALVRSRFPVRPSHWQQQLLVLESLPHPTGEDIARAWEAADGFARGIVERRPERLALGHMMVATVLARAGLADSAEAVIRDARQRLDDLGSQLRYAASYHEAAARLQLGQPDSALALLRHHGTNYAGRLAWLASDWWFRELWDDPRFYEITGVTPISDP